MKKLQVYTFVLLLVVIIVTGGLIALDKLEKDAWTYVLSGVFGLVVGYGLGRKDKPPGGLLALSITVLGLTGCSWFQSIEPALDAVETCSKIYLKSKLCEPIQSNDIKRICADIIDMGGARMWEKLREALDKDPRKDVPQCASVNEPK